MSCWLCEHAQEVAPLDWKEEAAEQKRLGLDYTKYHERKMFRCRLNPVWIDVKGSHVCGQFKDEHWCNPYKIKEIRDRMGNASDEFTNLVTRARDAERKLKKANARIKALRGKPDAG